MESDPSDEFTRRIREAFSEARMRILTQMNVLLEERGYPPLPLEVPEDVERRAAEAADLARALLRRAYADRDGLRAGEVGHGAPHARLAAS